MFVIHPYKITANPFVKTFIISEIFLWSAWNLVIPILSVFIVNTISGGTIEIAASGFSVYLISRVIFEFIGGKLASKLADFKKIHLIILGNLLTSLAFFHFSFATSIPLIFVSYALLGFGMGFASPLKLSLFSIHLDKNKESSEWSIYDGLTFIGMALSASIGGAIAAGYSFKVLFLVSSAVNVISIVPYIWYLKKGRFQQSR